MEKNLPNKDGWASSFAYEMFEDMEIIVIFAVSFVGAKGAKGNITKFATL